MNELYRTFEKMSMEYASKVFYLFSPFHKQECYDIIIDAWTRKNATADQKWFFLSCNVVSKFQFVQSFFFEGVSPLSKGEFSGDWSGMYDGECW